MYSQNLQVRISHRTTTTACTKNKCNFPSAMLAGIPVVAVQGSGQGYKIADPRPVDHIWPHLTRTAGSGQRGSGHGSTRGQRGSNLNRGNTIHAGTKKTEGSLSMYMERSGTCPLRLRIIHALMAWSIVLDCPFQDTRTSFGEATLYCWENSYIGAVFSSFLYYKRSCQLHCYELEAPIRFIRHVFR